MSPPEWHSLADKTIWVTGGAGYFGSAIVLALDRLCRTVVCIDLADRAAGLVVAHSLARTAAVSIDLSAVDTLSESITSLVNEHGVPDGLVHLSYASLGAGQPVAKLSAAVFQQTITQNLSPTFALCRELAEKMRPRHSGSFVLCSSIYGVVSPDPRIYHEPMHSNPIDYGASKAALLRMTRYFAAHYGPDALRFNALTPGAFPHPPLQQSDPGFIDRLAQRTALRRIGQAADIVGPALFLLTDSAAYITGHNLVVDGGWTVW